MIINFSFSNLLKILQMLLNSPENNFMKHQVNKYQGDQESIDVSFLIYCVKLLLMNFYRADDIKTCLVVSETKTILTDQFCYFG